MATTGVAAADRWGGKTNSAPWPRRAQPRRRSRLPHLAGLRMYRTSTSSAVGSLSPGLARSSRFVPSPAGSSSARTRLRSSATGPGTTSTGQPLAATTTWARATPAGMSGYSLSRCQSAPVASSSGQSMTGRSAGRAAARSPAGGVGRPASIRNRPSSFGSADRTPHREGSVCPSRLSPCSNLRLARASAWCRACHRARAGRCPTVRLPDGVKIPRAAASCVPISCRGRRGGPYGSGSTA